MLHRFVVIYRLMHASARRRLPLAALFGVVLSITEAFGIGLIFPLLLVASDPSKVQTNRYLKAMFEASGARDFEHFLVLIGAVIVTLFVTKNLFAMAVLRWQVRLLAKEECALANELYGYY